MHTLWIDKSKLVPTSNVYIYICKENDVLKDVLKYYSVLVKFLIISNYIGTMTFGPYYIKAAHTTTLSIYEIKAWKVKSKLCCFCSSKMLVTDKFDKRLHVETIFYIFFFREENSK